MIRRLDGIAFGGDYNPEQWPEATWHEDVRLMRVAGVNLVTVGVFAWSRLQPAPERWDFDWLDRVLDLLHQNDIAVDLATATASPPPWFSLRHPESLPVEQDGTRLAIGSRQHYCPSSGAFAAASVELAERMAERYGAHPALAMWHVGNEYGDHVEQCYCDRSAAHFREWLEARYGSVERLNEAWNTDVWSGRFSDWDEVMPPRKAPGPIRPSLKLDYRRFSSDALLACFERERDVLRRVTPDVPVTTNFMRPSPAIDHWRWAACEDVVSCDIYPDPLDPLADVDAAFTHDLMRSLGRGRPWLVLEQAPSAVDWRPVNLPFPPEVVRRRSIEAVGAGADGICFFQWRASRGGPEMLHSSMLPPGGEASAGWDATVRLGADLGRLAEVAGSRCPTAEVALLYDWEAWWALEQEGHPSDRLHLRDLSLAMYAPMRSAGLAVDMRHPEDSLEPYRVVVAPNLFLMSPEAVQNLTTFVERGGVALVGPFSGIVQPNCERAEGAHPSLLRDLLGIAVEEWWPVAEGDVGCRFEDGTACRATVWREALVASGAEVVARFEDAPLAGSAAVSRHRVGAGQAWYLGTVPDAAGMAHLLGLVAAQAGVAAPMLVPDGVEVRRRAGGGVAWLFVANRTDDEVEVGLDEGEYHDLLADAAVHGVVRLGPQGAAVLRTPA